MGVHGDVNKRCKEIGENAPDGTVVLNKNVFYTPEQVRSANGIVVAEDIMASPNGPYTWCKLGTDPKADVPMLGIDYWLKFLRFITTRIEMKPRHIVLCADDRKYTPIEKIPTQEKRQESNKVEKRLTLSPHDEAHKNHIFTDDGICHPEHSTQDAMGNWEYVALAPSICRSSSHLRKPLIRYFIKKLEHWIRENYALFASSVQTIDFDYDGNQYLSFQHHTPGSTSIMEWKPLPFGHVVYGEGDGKIIQWADYYMDQYHIQLATVDTDLVSWSTGLVHRHRLMGFKTCIHWINVVKTEKDKGKIIIIELNKYITYLIAAFKLHSYRDLLVWTIIAGGTDYWDKNWLTKHFGSDEILKSLVQLVVSIALSLITFESWSIEYPAEYQKQKDQVFEKEIDTTVLAIQCIIDHLEYPEMKKPPKKVTEKTKPIKIPAKLQHKPTNELVIRTLAVRLWWHIGYCEMNNGIATKILHDRYQKDIRCSTLANRLTVNQQPLPLPIMLNCQ